MFFDEFLRFQRQFVIQQIQLNKLILNRERVSGDGIRFFFFTQVNKQLSTLGQQIDIAGFKRGYVVVYFVPGYLDEIG